MSPTKETTISLDTNLFIDLFQEDREHAHKLLDSLAKQREITQKSGGDIRVAIHLKQLDEILHKIENLIDTQALNPTDEEDAKSLHGFLEDLKTLSVTNPQALKNRNILFGDPHQQENTLASRHAKDAETLATNLRNLHPELQAEWTDAVIFAFAKKTKAYLFSRDNHITLLGQLTQKEEASNPRPSWYQKEEVGYPLVVNPQYKKIPPCREKKTAKKRVEDLLMI